MFLHLFVVVERQKKFKEIRLTDYLSFVLFFLPLF